VPMRLNGCDAEDPARVRRRTALSALCRHCRQWHPVTAWHSEGTPYTLTMLYWKCAKGMYYAGQRGHVRRHQTRRAGQAGTAELGLVFGLLLLSQLWFYSFRSGDRMKFALTDASSQQAMATEVALSWPVNRAIAWVFRAEEIAEVDDSLDLHREPSPIPKTGNLALSQTSDVNFVWVLGSWSDQISNNSGDGEVGWRTSAAGIGHFNLIERRRGLAVVHDVKSHSKASQLLRKSTITIGDGCGAFLRYVPVGSIQPGLVQQPQGPFGNAGAAARGVSRFLRRVEGAAEQDELPYRKNEQQDGKADLRVIESVPPNFDHWHRPHGYGLIAGLLWIWGCYGVGVLLGVTGGNRIYDGRRGGWLLVGFAVCFGLFGGISTAVGPPWLWR
jgi:hypothetical protein